MKRRNNNFRKKKKRNGTSGLCVDVRNNNVETALKIFKRKVKDSGLMLELKKRSYYEKPSEIKRYTKNMQKLRYKYKQEKENNSY